MAVFIITLIEVMLLVRLAHALGFGFLLLWLTLAALVGVNLFRYARRTGVRGGADTGAVALELADRAVLSAAAVLFIIPGFLSDLVAIALVLPGNRKALAHGLATRFAGSFTAANDPFAQDAVRAQSGERSRGDRKPRGDRKQGPGDGGQVIEGEFIRRDESARSKPGP